MTTSVYRRRYYQKLVDNGQCPRCQKKITDKRWVKCKICRDRDKKYRKERGGLMETRNKEKSECCNAPIKRMSVTDSRLLSHRYCTECGVRA